MYDNVLIPTDGSEPADTAVTEGIQLAVQNDATVHGLCAIEPIPLGGFAAGAEPASKEWGSVVDAQTDEGEQATAAITDAAQPQGVDVVEAIRHGTPAETILEYVDEHDIDVIVMGTHGRSGIDRHVIGSVTEKVVRKSPVPVLAVKAGE